MNKALLKLHLLAENLKNGEEGQDLVEYALLMSMISLALIASMNTIASAINTFFSNVSTSLAWVGDSDRTGADTKRLIYRELRFILVAHIERAGLFLVPAKILQRRETMNNALLKLRLLAENLKNGEEGQDLVEYALLVSLIALAAIASVGTVSSAITTIFNNMASSLA
jgi:pilus assembly protein Flp/PilA